PNDASGGQGHRVLEQRCAPAGANNHTSAVLLAHAQTRLTTAVATAWLAAGYSPAWSTNRENRCTLGAISSSPRQLAKLEIWSAEPQGLELCPPRPHGDTGSRANLMALGFLVSEHVEARDDAALDLVKDDLAPELHCDPDLASLPDTPVGREQAQHL